MKKFQQDNNKKKLKSQETFSRIFPKITKDERNQFEVDIMQWQAIHKVSFYQICSTKIEIIIF